MQKRKIRPAIIITSGSVMDTFLVIFEQGRKQDVSVVWLAIAANLQQFANRGEYIHGEVPIVDV